MIRPHSLDCGCVYTDERTGLCEKHFSALLDVIAELDAG